MKIILIFLIASSFQLRTRSESNIFYNLIKNGGNFEEKRVSCLSKLSNKQILSNFSEIFNPECPNLTKCYRVLDSNLYTKEQCDENFLEALKEKCNNLAFKKNLCLRKAEEWKEFVDEYLDDHFKEQSVYKVVILSNVYDASFLTIADDLTFTNATGGSPTPMSKFNLISVGDSNFVIKHAFSDVCLNYEIENDDVGFALCAVNSEEQHFYFSTSDYPGFFFIKALNPNDESYWCLDEDGDVSSCDEDQTDLSWVIMYQNGERAFLKDFMFELK